MTYIGYICVTSGHIESRKGQLSASNGGVPLVVPFVSLMPWALRSPFVFSRVPYLLSPGQTAYLAVSSELLDRFFLVLQFPGG